eukprot:1035133-Amphidinium_carterae.1
MQWFQKVSAQTAEAQSAPQQFRPSFPVALPAKTRRSIPQHRTAPHKKLILLFRALTLEGDQSKGIATRTCKKIGTNDCATCCASQRQRHYHSSILSAMNPEAEFSLK